MKLNRYNETPKDVSFFPSVLGPATELNFVESYCLNYIDPLGQKGTTFLGQGPPCISFSAFEGRIQNYDPNFRESSLIQIVSFN